MTLLRFTYIALYCFFSISSSARGDFMVTPSIEKAYDLVISLQFEEGQMVLDQIKTDDPNNLLVYHVENYIDFIKVFIGEDIRDLEQFRINKDYRLQLIRQGNPNSPYYQFSQAEILLQWAVARAKFEQFWRAGWDINKAYKLLKKNERAFPDFGLNKKSLSLIHSLIGSVRGLKKGLVSLFTSLEGSTQLGIAEIDELYEDRKMSPALFEKEILVVRALMALHIEKDSKRAYTLINQDDLQNHPSPLLGFLRTTIALHNGRNLEALEILDQINHEEKFPFYYLQLVEGREKLKLLDPTAKDHLITFIQRYKGENYKKEAYQKLAWYDLVIQNDPVAYRKWMDRCLSEGQAVIGEDEQALEEARSGKQPNLNLLRARLLFDGNQYSASMERLEEIDKNILDEEESLEYHYRYARNYQKLKMTGKAIGLFGLVLNRGKSTNSYYACNAALQMGILFYERGEFKRAEHYFNICLDVQPKEHKNSLHQKAIIWKEKIKNGVS